jgi:hypothetical protein
MTMTIQEHDTRRALSDDEIDALMVEVEKGQQLAGHFPSAEALDRARRVLTGATSHDDALSEIYAEFAS